MIDKNFDVYNTILAEMKERDMISPFLYEGLRDDDFDEIIEESRSKDTRPVRYATGVGDERIFWFYGAKVSESRFLDAWSDLITYPKNFDAASFIRDVISADLDEIPESTSKGHSRYLDAISKLISSINKQREAEGISERVPYKRERERVYRGMSKAEDDRLSTIPQSRSTRAKVRTPELSINHRGQRDPRIERINSQELTPGEFYTDVSRIPPRAYSLFQKLSGQLRSIPPDKLSFGSKWQKSFVYGYAPTLSGTGGAFVYEVWYNSIDSTFSLHDGHGNDVTNYRYPTLMEVTRALFNAIVSKSSGDDAYSKDSPQFQSVLRSVGSAVDSHVGNMLKKEASEKRDLEQKLKTHLDNFENKEAAEIFNQMYPDGFIDPAQKVELAEKYASVIKGMMSQYRSGNIDQNTVNEIINLMDSEKYAKFSKFKRMADNKIADARDSKESRQHSNTPTSVKPMSVAPTSDDEEKAFTRMSDPSSVNYSGLFDSLVSSVGAEGDYVDDMRSMLRNVHYNQAQYYDLLNDFSSRYLKNAVDRLKSEHSLGREVKTDLNKKRVDFETLVRNSLEGDAVSDVTNLVARTLNDGVSKLSRIVTNHVKEKSKKSEKETVTVESENPFLELRETLLEELRNDRDQLLRTAFNDDQYEIDKFRRDFESNAHTPNKIGEIRQQAVMSGKTQKAIMDAISNDLISVYYETRAKDISWLEWVFSKSWLAKVPGLSRRMRGRAAPIETPVKGIFKGSLYHASFVQGYDLRGGPDLEIWYITEPGAEGFLGKTRVISSFYIYDVKAKKVVRRYIPYVRHAVQEVNKKISFVTGPGMG